MKYIASRNNPLVKKMMKLGKNKDRELFFVEGARFVRSALEYGLRPMYLVCAESAFGVAQDFERNYDVSVYVLNDKLFSEVADTEHSQGLLGVYRRGDVCDYAGAFADYEYQAPSRESSRESVVLVLDEVQDPGNVGAIVRTADAAGYKDIFVVRGTADPYSPKAARASAGSILNVRVRSGTRAEILDYLKRREYNILVTAIGGDDFRNVVSQRGVKSALVLGNEARGVHSDFLEAADMRVGIPIYGGAESLNVAVAAGILIYHFRGYDEK